MIVSLDFKSEVPIYLQLRNEIIRGIGSGMLSMGEKLPTVRNLAQDIGVNPMTVNKTYALLRKEGFILTDGRRGAVVISGTNTDAAYKEKLTKQMEILASEAAIKGMGEKEFLTLCENLYRKLKIKKLVPEAGIS
ncbi:GntR family transcriptional regulator [Anaerocolumna jejuensis]|uniref:GntR family transcriptional regulator n=1 Tax=Anaerocolumna jejuensis TaxID=259063 RepID=UPI003F7BAACD